MKLPVLLIAAALAADHALAEVRAAIPPEFATLEATWNSAHLSGNWEALGAMWADDITIVVPKMAPFHKAEVRAMWKNSPVRFTVYESSLAEVRQFGDTAVAIGRIHRSRDFSGRKAEESWHFTKVYRRQGSDWLVVAFHASEVPSP